LGDIGGLQGLIFQLFGFVVNLYAANLLNSYLVETLFNGKHGRKFEFGYRSHICRFQNKQLNKRRSKGMQRIDYNIDVVNFIRQQILFKLNFLKTYSKE
jgi:hypothetical protein